MLSIAARRWLRRLGFAAALLAVIVTIAIVALQSGPVRRMAQQKIVGLLAAQDITFSSESFDYSLLGLKTELRNIRVASSRVPNAPPFIEVERLRVDLSAWQVLRGRYVVESGGIDGVRVHYFVSESGEDNLPRPPQNPDESGQPINHLIARLSVPNAWIRYENRAQAIDLTLPGVSLTVDGDAITDRHDVTIDAAGGELRVRGRDLQLDRISVALDLGRDDVSIERAELEAEGAAMNATGTVKSFDAPILDVTAQATVDAARAAEVGGLKERISGLVAIETSVAGALDAAAIRARVTGNELQLRELAGIHADITADYRLGEDLLRVSRLNVSSPAGAIDGDSTVVLRGADRSRVHARLHDVSVEPIMRALDVPYRVASRITGEVDASWPGRQYEAATGTGRLTLTPTRTSAAASAMPVGGSIAIDANGSLALANVRNVRVAAASVNGRVELTDRRRLAGVLRARADNVQATVSALEAFLGRRAGSLTPVAVEGALSTDARIGGTIDAPLVTADLHAPSLSLGEITDVSAVGTVAYRPDAIAIDRFDVAWRQARVQASGTMGLRGRRALDLSVRADAVPVSDLLGAIGRADLPADGVLNASAHVAGTVEQPLATWELRGSDLVAYNEVLGTLAADGRVEGQRIDVASLELTKPQPSGEGRVTANGSYQLTTRHYAVDLRSTNVHLTSLVLPNDMRVTGAVELRANGSGTIDDPAGTIDLNAEELVVGGYTIGGVVTKASLANRRATIAAAATRYALTTNATIATTAPYHAVVSARVADLNLATLPATLETPLVGTLSAEADAEGPLSNPQSGRATAAIGRFAGEWRQQPFSLEGPARLRYADEQLTIEQLVLTASDSSLAVTGTLPVVDRPAPGTIMIDGRANLATLAQYAPVGTNIAADGRLTVKGTLIGTVKAIDPDVTITLEDALVLSPAIEPGLSNLTATARIAAGEASVEQLTANWGSAAISVSARVPLDLLPELPVEIPHKAGPAMVKAQLDGLDPSAIPGAPHGVSGRISFDADVSARRPDLREADGRVAFRDLQLGYESLTIAQQQPSALVVRDGVLTIEQFALAGSVGTLAAVGTIGLLDTRPLNIDVDGRLNIAAVELVTDRIRAEGDSSLDVTARGTVAEPILSGHVAVSDGNLVVEDPNLAAEAVNLRLDLDGNRLNISQLSANVNGGTLTGSGGLALAQGGPTDVNIALQARDFAYDAPLDLRSLSDADLTVTSKGGDIVVGGQITIQESGLTGDINFDTGLLATITARRQLELTPERHPLVERVTFNVDVDTVTPIIVDNNLAKAEVTTDLRVVGTPYEPGLLGRLEVLEGGLVTLNERIYHVERGAITFLDDRRIYPSFDLTMTTNTGNYDVTLGVSGELNDTETTLTSNPALPEPDIMALLITGRTLEEMRGEEYDVAREQVLSHLTGRVGSSLGRGIQRATGLDEVRIVPQVIANESNPGARLTVSEDITDDVNLVYSVDLADSDDQIWVATYDVTRRFQTRGVRQEDNTYRFDFRHDIRRGGQPEPRREARVRPTVTEVSVPEDAPIPAADLRKMLGAKPDKEFDYFAVRNGIEDIEARLREAGWMQSRVRLDREADDTTVRLHLRITRGPRIEFVYAGATPPGKVQEEVGLQWHRGVFDAQRTDDTAEAIVEWLMDDHYLQAKAEVSVEEVSAEQRRVRVTITPGPQSRRVLLAFEGASGIPAKELDQVIGEQRLERQLFTDPGAVTELLERLYREQGYLNADIEEPRYEFEGDVARIVLPVHEGPLFTVNEVTMRGNSALAATTLTADLPVVTGAPYRPAAVENALQHVRNLYWAQGYNDVRVGYDLVVDRPGGRAGVAFTIDEGRQAVVADIRITGNDETSERLVREQLVIEPQQPLNLRELSRSRKNLYDSGAYSMVDLSRETVTESGDDGFVGALSGTAPAAKPVVVDVGVREVQPYQFRYGLSYDTEGGVGGVFDASVHNVLGKARVFGVSGRYDKQLHEGRLYLSQPTLRNWPIETIASVYYTEERNPETNVSDAFNVDRKGASIQQERKLGNSFVWTYGYRFERAVTWDPEPGGDPEQFTKVSPLTSAFVRDVREDVLDATRGSFNSQALAFSPSWLGSDDTYLKYMGQYFHYFPLQSERRRRFSNEIIRPRLVFATGVRIGLSKGMGTFVPSTERFFAGGSSTVRGFEQNALGPISTSGKPLGGDAMLVLNNELRFPLISLVDGVGFVDVGNVFLKTSDFSLTDLRKTAGVGLRLRTKWVLVRTDYGFVLDRRQGERRGRFYFSIGQAF
jgi:outer membrane protein assembly complex protein YaeT